MKATTLGQLKKLQDDPNALPDLDWEDLGRELLDYTIRLADAAKAIHGFPDKSASHDALRDALNAPIYMPALDEAFGTTRGKVRGGASAEPPKASMTNPDPHDSVVRRRR